MDLKTHYDRLYWESVSLVNAGKYQIDPLIDSPNDNRRGVTLRLRPDEETLQMVLDFLDKLRVIEPGQYFYPAPNIHVTVMSIISCRDGFRLSQIEVARYIEIIQQCLDGLKPFTIEFRGLTLSPSCLMVQGFFVDNTLPQLRDRLRDGFRSSGLQQSLDVRYKIETAHSTIFRLREPLANPGAFLRLVDEYRDFHFGTFTADTLEFVCNDWYHKSDCVQVLSRLADLKKTAAR